MESIRNRLIASTFKKIFPLLYHEFAWSYDIVAGLVSLGLWNQWISTTISFLDQSPMLELGFGRGHLQAQILKHQLEIIGIDESRQMIRLAKRALSQAGFHPKLVHGTAQNLPFESASFLRVVATFPSEYIIDHRTLSEIHRILIKGGKVVILPAAWITGGALPHRFAAKVFQVTHQAPSKEQLETTWVHLLQTRLIEFGFKVSRNWLTLKNSEILLIIGEKPV